MARLIDADAIDKRYVPIAPVIEGDEVHYEWVAFVEDINEQPTVDAVPIRHGKWVFNPSDALEAMFAKPKCSECGFESADGGNYCPECGADMRGESNE